MTEADAGGVTGADVGTGAGSGSPFVGGAGAVIATSSAASSGSMDGPGNWYWRLMSNAWTDEEIKSR